VNPPSTSALWPQQLHDEGFAVLPAVLSAAEVDVLQRATDELEARARDFEVSTGLRGVFFEVQSLSGRKGEPAVQPGALRKITGPSKGHPAFADLRRSPALLALVEQAGLRLPRCVVDQVNFKHPRLGTGFPYHQDASFLHGDAMHDLERCGGLNMVIALDAADADNGGFRVLGGTHRPGLLLNQHGYDTSTMNEGVFDESRLAIPALHPGDAVFFDPLLAHGSGPNRSDRRRRLLTLWFVGGAPRLGLPLH
jgi:phytanoyl-CoA hydroxylase